MKETIKSDKLKEKFEELEDYTKTEEFKDAVTNIKDSIIDVEVEMKDYLETHNFKDELKETLRDIEETIAEARPEIQNWVDETWK